MTWITNDGVASTINLSHSNGAESIFILKRLLKQAGWTVLSSSDGITYNSIGDQITHSGTGANGMNNNYAWFRIEDPASLREYVIQRYTNHYQWKWHYSASDGFTGGAPDFDTIPTANDMKGIAENDTAFRNIFPPSGPWRIHFAAENAAHNGVYSWWYSSTGPSSYTGTGLCDAIDLNTSDSGDNDPCAHYCSYFDPAYSQISSTATSTRSFRCWLRYGESDEEWAGITAVYYTGYSLGMPPYPSSDALAKDPHNSFSYVMLPVWLVRATGSSKGNRYKGCFKNVRWNPNASVHTYGDLIQVGSEYWFVCGDLLLRGWPDSTTPLT